MGRHLAGSPTFKGLSCGRSRWPCPMCCFPSHVCADCKTVQVGVRQEAQWIKSSKRRYSRIWCIIHSALDDGDSADTVVCMPERTGKDRIGEARCSAGQQLSRDMMLHANCMVDLMAKGAADRVRQPLAARSLVKHRFTQVKGAAIFGKADLRGGDPCLANWRGGEGL